MMKPAMLKASAPGTPLAPSSAGGCTACENPSSRAPPSTTAAVHEAAAAQPQADCSLLISRRSRDRSNPCGTLLDATPAIYGGRRGCKAFHARGLDSRPAATMLLASEQEAPG